MQQCNSQGGPLFHQKFQCLIKLVSKNQIEHPRPIVQSYALGWKLDLKKLTKILVISLSLEELKKKSHVNHVVQYLVHIVGYHSTDDSPLNSCQMNQQCDSRSCLFKRQLGEKLCTVAQRIRGEFEILWTWASVQEKIQPSCGLIFFSGYEKLPR